MKNEIARLGALDNAGLRLAWRNIFVKTAPTHLPKHLLVRIISYRLQANAYGDLDRKVAQMLDRRATQAAVANCQVTVEKRPSRILKPGTVIGGVALATGPLAYLLRNRVYLGELNHRGKSYPGAHQAIVDVAVFDAVQMKLTGNRNNFRQRRSNSDALLLGRVFDDRGNRMTPSYAIKKGVRYRYYTSCVLAQGRKEQAGSVARVAAPEIEVLVLRTLQPLMGLDRSCSRSRSLVTIDLSSQTRAD
jgi:hypothetical protein